MTLKTRLTKIETPVTERWRAAWEGYFDHLVNYLEGPVDLLSPAATEAEAQGLFKDEAALNASAAEFCKRIGISDLPALTTWNKQAVLPDLDAPPDLSRWPYTLPEPPPEPSGVFEKLEPYKDSPDLHERLPALLCLFWLAHARAHRAYLAEVVPAHR